MVPSHELEVGPLSPRRQRQAPLWMLLAAAFIFVLAAAFAWGAPVPLADLWSHDAAAREVARHIFLELRRDRIVAGLLVGASLATAGAALQAVFRNPLAEPYLLGISSGGALGATAAAALGWPAVGIFDAPTALAFVGALGASWLVYWLGQSRAASSSGASLGLDRARLLLSGVALSSFLGALMALIVTLSNRLDMAQQVTFWLLGSLSRATPAQNWVLAVCLLAGLAVLAGSARDLNALRVGDEEAAALGVDLRTLHRRLLGASALLSAAAVAASGLIGFVGLLAPHMVRLLLGSNARALIPAAALGGATLLVGCDALARSALAPLEIPVGIVSALLGVPLFLFLARRT